MSYIRYIVFFHIIAASPQINLYNTDDSRLEHGCLRVITANDDSSHNRQVTSYCMSESSTQFDYETNSSFFQKFTFAELSAKAVTSEQLYIWSAPMDLVERYQSYLLTPNRSLLGEESYYNCTPPRFGPRCQYRFHSNGLSLSELVHNYYLTSTYNLTNLTCYTHLECDRGHSSICLDWSEICDGHVHCLNDKADEKDCWPLETNECNENEYRCKNGQCVPESFYGDDSSIPDCLDRTDEHVSSYPPIYEQFQKSTSCHSNIPHFACEDSQCVRIALTSSCLKFREESLISKLFSLRDNFINDKCWSTFNSFLRLSSSIDPIEDDFCKSIYDRDCHETILKECPDLIFRPTIPVLFGTYYFAYPKNDLENPRPFQNRRFPYFCRNSSVHCEISLGSSAVHINNLTCYAQELRAGFYPLIDGWGRLLLYQTWRSLWPWHEPFYYNSTICNRSSMYQCEQSRKCISKFRLNDQIRDCPHYDDDLNWLLPTEDLTIGISGAHDEESKKRVRLSKLQISYQTICDGYTELHPINTTEGKSTDETECEQWECNNIYTRCNGLWNCWDGEDEIGCNFSLPLNCTSTSHLCVSRYTNKFMCLPIEKANDGRSDCLGAFDEPIFCRLESGIWIGSANFHCKDARGFTKCVATDLLCNGLSHCGEEDDEQFCQKNRTHITKGGICLPENAEFRSEVERYVCKMMNAMDEKAALVYFALNTTKPSAFGLSKKFKDIVMNDFSIDQSSHCHRGLSLHVHLRNTTATACFCPPSYYGVHCQYQNQRVPLTIQFRTFLDFEQTLYAIVISLVDDKTVHSFEQITYSSTRDCSMKYHFYLLYTTRPKDASKQYSIKIDIYEKISRAHRGRLLYPMPFSFLPVYRLSLLVDIPQRDTIETCSDRYCLRGRCIYYSNSRGKESFCQCDEGWSGLNCSIPLHCACSSDSLCVGIDSNNRSICVCPIHKFGSRCLLIDRSCDNGTCLHGGQCVPNGDYAMSNQRYYCLCTNGFSGSHCENEDSRIILSLEKKLVFSSSIFIHLIQVVENNSPVRSTTVKTIFDERDAITIRWSLPFHMAFIELLDKTYYWVHTQNTYQPSGTLTKTVRRSDRCLQIRELFNDRFLDMHLIRRIKYYHLPCQNSSLHLSCFYDEVHLCICYDLQQRRLANCFDFDHNLTSHCLIDRFCKNDGKCFQDHPTCPRKTMCICPPCFYGSLCQFTTSGFGLSLDAILGYHIRPHRNVFQQPLAVTLSAALNIIFLALGLLNGALTMVTFKNKSVRSVGCGVYLFGSSVVALMTTIMFGLKFWILVLTQTATITNRLFLKIQCISLDFLLRVSLHMSEWLHACVACERAVTTVQGPSFSKKRSKQIAKFMIVALVVIITGSSIDDPTHRSLIDETNEDGNRLWCVVSYSSTLAAYNYAIQCFHFFAPFLINLTSAVVLIVQVTVKKTSSHTQHTFREHLRRQFSEHKHLLTAPAVLVIFALPRLVSTFVSKCMHSVNDASLFLVGYYISLIPPMLTFAVFILPSKFYKKEFFKSLARYREQLRSRVQSN